jgi:uronate dehydrogenase
MNISIIGAQTPLGNLLVQRLRKEHTTRLYGSDWYSAEFQASSGTTGESNDGGRTGALETGAEIPTLDLRDERDAGRCCRDAQAIIHLGMAAPASSSPQSGAPDSGAVERLDIAARGTYNLFLAAREAGVDRIVFASSLSFFDAYDKDYLIDEGWKPLPGSDPEVIAVYAAEEVARQCCMHGGIKGVGLRFLPFGDDPENDTLPTDAVAAIECALEVPLGVPGYRWQVFHIARAPRFITRQARTVLGWEVEDA